MKKNFFTVVFIIAFYGINPTFAQSEKIPDAITTGLTAKFPQAGDIKWQLNQQGDYDATFVFNEKNYRVQFANNGDWKLTERIIKKDYLPTSVSKSFYKSEYSKWEISEVTVIETPQNKIQFKILVIKNGITRKNLLYNKDGQLLTDSFTTL